MEDGKAHPLLAQIPLTVSPFVDIPKATNLSYAWKGLPSTLPPSTTGEAGEKKKYVISQSGHAAHPDEIIASCQALQAHLKKLQDDAEQTIKKWQDDIRERELAEKRRVAPGWLDREEKILQPTKRTSMKAEPAPASLMDVVEEHGQPATRSLPQQIYDEGEEMDRAFGGMSLQK